MPPPVARPEPDLVVRSISVSNNTPTRGQRFTLSVTVHNRGNARAEVVDIAFLGGYTRRSEFTEDVSRVKSLEPSETFTHTYSLVQRAGTTVRYTACVYLNDPRELEDCSNNEVRVTVSEGSGGGNGNGGGSGSRIEPVTTKWACPFGSGGSITVPHATIAVYDAEIRFRGNTCGNFYVSAAGPGTAYYHNEGVGRLTFNDEPDFRGNLGISFSNDNSSGRTVVRQYTAYFCRKNDVSHSAFCYRGQESRRSTFTVRWLSE